MPSDVYGEAHPCRTHRVRNVIAITLIALIITAAFGENKPAAATPAVVGSNDPIDRRRAAIETYLQHLYSVYQGLRSCTEISQQQNDRSFLPDLSVAEARATLRRIDAAGAEVGIDTSQVWNAISPQAVVTAEALKTNPASHLQFCQLMTSLFRVDTANLQSNLVALGAKQALIVKDY